MKITIPFRILKVVSLLFVFSAGFAMPRVANGVGIAYDLVLTENSSSDLSLSYNGPAGASGFTVMNTGTDQWTIQINSLALTFDPQLNVFWEEPEDPLNSANQVLHNLNDRVIFVSSEVPSFPGAGNFPNNTADPVFVGSDNTNSSQPVPIRLTFNDLGDVAPPTNGVPEVASTLGLLTASVIVLFGLSRFCAARS